MYHERLGLVQARDALSLDSALSSGDVSGAWLAWSSAAESALVEASCLAGGPIPAWAGVLRASIGYGWVDPKCA